MILHWLGDMFDPQLAGYWGSADLDTATETVLALIREHAERIDGIKISLLDEGARDRSCAGACRRACGCSPATTSTMPS